MANPPNRPQTFTKFFQTFSFFAKCSPCLPTVFSILWKCSKYPPYFFQRPETSEQFEIFGNKLGELCEQFATSWKRILGNLRDREIACSASSDQGSNYKSCVWREVSSHSSHHHHEVFPAGFSLLCAQMWPKTALIYFFSLRKNLVTLPLTVCRIFT